MPRWDSFGRSLVFAALAAAGLPVAVTFAGALFGAESAVRLYVIAAASAYAIGLCPDRSRSAAALAFAALVGVILALLPLDLRATAVGAAGIIAFVRGVVLANRRTLRALAIEVVFAAAGLAAAAHFARGGPRRPLPGGLGLLPGAERLVPDRRLRRRDGCAGARSVRSGARALASPAGRRSGMTTASAGCCRRISKKGLAQSHPDRVHSPNRARDSTSATCTLSRRCPDSPDGW